MNSEGLYLIETILYNLCGCFDIVFAQLGAIPRTRNKFVERVVVAERSFIISHVKNKESKKHPFRIWLPVKLADGRTSMKNEVISSYLVYNIVSLGKMAGKTEPFP